MPPQKISIVSLYSGPGGMDTGFRSQGFLPLLALDADQSAVTTYNLNHELGVARRADLSELTDEQIIELVRTAFTDDQPRGVIGGPPCQSVSRGNNHHKRNDPRKKSLLRYAQIIKALNKEFSLDFFVFENVVGLKSNKHKKFFRRIIKTFEEAGFTIFESELNAKFFGVPQNRKRVIIVGINNKLYPNLEFKFPSGTPHVKTVADAIAHLPEPVFFKKDLTQEDIPFHPNHWSMNPRSPKFTKPSQGKGRSFRRLSWEQPSWTVAYGHREMHVHPGGTRRVSVYEAMLLQGFPHNYKLSGNLSEQVIQVSNAVPPPLAAAVARAIRAAIYEPIESIQNNLLAWFENNERSFPWRSTSNPYKIMIAEKLLQQTAASDQVVLAYQEIIKRYPSLQRLAMADVDALKDIIRPLGFIYRAGELPALAGEIIERFNGHIPRDLKSLLSLPGIGDYAARAILSFAFKFDYPVVDTNVARWLHRVFGIAGPLPANPARNRHLIALANTLVPSGNSRNFNLAVLDVCAAICTVRQPKCAQCPVRSDCSYGKQNTAGNAAEVSLLAA